MKQFDHKITEARAAFRDPEDFWVFGDWVDAQKVFVINDDIEAGKARIITDADADNMAIITFGGGYHWQVEHVTRCSVCGVQITFDETGQFGACNADQDQAAADYDAAHYA